MSANETGSWSALPEADTTAATGRPHGRPVVVALGAFCDLDHRSHANDEFSQSFSVSEFALLSNGDRIALHHNRGFTIGSGSGEPVLRSQTATRTVRDVLNVVLPDDSEATGEDHPWNDLANLMRERGLRATPDRLRSLPYEVLLSQKLIEWLDAPVAT